VAEQQTHASSVLPKTATFRVHCQNLLMSYQPKASSAHIWD